MLVLNRQTSCPVLGEGASRPLTLALPMVAFCCQTKLFRLRGPLQGPCAHSLPASAQCCSALCPLPVPPNGASALSVRQNAAGAARVHRSWTEASFPGLGPSSGEVRQGGGEKEGGEEGLSVWEAREVLQNLWMAQPAAVGSHGARPASG